MSDPTQPSYAACKLHQTAPAPTLSASQQVSGRRCDNITISPNLLQELEDSHDPLPRKLWPSMGGQGQERIPMTGDNYDTFKKMHGEVGQAWKPCSL